MGVIRFRALFRERAVQLACVSVKHSPSGGRTAGWEVFHFVVIRAEPPYDLERTDVVLRELLACSLFQLFPPNHEKIPWAVIFRFFVFGVVISFLPRLVDEHILALPTSNVISPNFRVAIFRPREVGWNRV